MAVKVEADLSHALSQERKDKDAIRWCSRSP
jgi:hypothetical protein